MRDLDWTTNRPPTQGGPATDRRDDSPGDNPAVHKQAGRPAPAHTPAMEQTVALELSTPWTLRRVRACLLA